MTKEMFLYLEKSDILLINIHFQAHLPACSFLCRGIKNSELIWRGFTVTGGKGGQGTKRYFEYIQLQCTQLDAYGFAMKLTDCAHIKT